MKMPRDRDREVKLEKKFSRILEKRDSRRALALTHERPRLSDKQKHKMSEYLMQTLVNILDEYARVIDGVKTWDASKIFLSAQ